MLVLLLLLLLLLVVVIQYSCKHYGHIDALQYSCKQYEHIKHENCYAADQAGDHVITPSFFSLPSYRYGLDFPLPGTERIIDYQMVRTVSVGPADKKLAHV